MTSNKIGTDYFFHILSIAKYIVCYANAHSQKTPPQTLEVKYGFDIYYNLFH